MFHHYTPFYRKFSKEEIGYTLFLDEKSGKIYKANHKKVNQWHYWILFALILGVMRSIQNVHIPKNFAFLISLIVFEILVSLYIGFWVYKSYYLNGLKEIFITKEMLNDYIDQGRSMFRIDLIATITLFIFFVLSVLLFLVTDWLVWYLLSFVLLALVFHMLCGFSKKRYKLFKGEMKNV